MTATYRGWTCHFDLTPLPVRGFDWTATSPGFDADLVDGEWVSLGRQVNAATLEGLHEEIDIAIEEMEDEHDADA